MLAEKVRDLGLDRIGKQGTSPIAQNFCELIVEDSWLNQLGDVIIEHGISLLRWRSGGVKHPHDMPPFPFPPSPTFGDSSFIKLHANEQRPNERIALSNHLAEGNRLSQGSPSYAEKIKMLITNRPPAMLHVQVQNLGFGSLDIGKDGCRGFVRSLFAVFHRKAVLGCRDAGKTKTRGRNRPPEQNS